MFNRKNGCIAGRPLEMYIQGIHDNVDECARFSNILRLRFDFPKQTLFDGDICDIFFAHFHDFTDFSVCRRDDHTPFRGISLRIPHEDPAVIDPAQGEENDKEFDEDTGQIHIFSLRELLFKS